MWCLAVSLAYRASWLQIEMEQMMTNLLFKECLTDVYHGEQTGEIAYEGMLQMADTPEQAFIIGSFLQLETEGKALMRPTLVRYGVPLVDTPAARENGIAAADGLAEIPWEEKFSAISEMVKASYLPRYEELASLISPDEDPEAYKLAKFMGAHDRALIVASDNVAAGRTDAMKPVTDLLNFPLKMPS